MYYFYARTDDRDITEKDRDIFVTFQRDIMLNLHRQTSAKYTNKYQTENIQKNIQKLTLKHI